MTMNKARVLTGEEARKAAAIFRQIDEQRSGSTEGLIISGPVRGLSTAPEKTARTMTRNDRRRKLEELRRKLDRVMC